MSYVLQIGFDGAAAFASAMLELAAVAPDRSLVQGAGAAERRGRGGYPERPDEVQANVRGADMLD